ncbi:ABC transporter substrate-binding protein [Nitratireductor kimnyeongensis]|uniref:ABC transporter substrate-binding protein n=1 Tax=Nitratireductor kimnyeongensis TaxID=430679 RepID=A0ABW0T7G4_9HYPH|nr:ABC transporter substrate-binding protein [Nitratireductor kimnyeongensis]QZZ34625.1 ABC transporter substrate-binding protein [Nitratireductor kimnyeongensis]
MRNTTIAALAAILGMHVGAAHSAELIIGELHPITGPASFYGLPESRGVQLAVGEINDAGGIKIGDETYTIKLVTEDTQAKATIAVAGLKKLQAENVKYLIGPLSSGVAPGLMPIIAKSDMTQIIDGSIADGITNGKNIFRNQATVSGYDKAVVELFKAKKYKSVAFMTDRFHAGFMGTQEALSNSLGEMGTTIAQQEYYKLGDTDFSAAMTNVAGKNPEALVIRGYPAEGALITKQARQLGFQGQIVWEMVAPPSTVLKNIPKEQMDGVFNCIPPTVEDYVKLDDEKAKILAEAYKAKFGEQVGELTGLSYDAVYIYKAAFEKAGSIDNAKVNEALAGLMVADVPELVTRYTPQDDGRLFDDVGQVDLQGIVSVWKGEAWEPADLGN